MKIQTSRLALLVALLVCSGGCLSCFGITLPDIPDASAILNEGDGIGNLEAFFDGGTATFGTLTMKIDLNGGAGTMAVSQGNDAPFLSLEYPDQFHTYGTGVIEANGQPSYLYDRTDDGGIVNETEQRDTDGDGVMDQIDVRSFDRSHGLPLAETDSRYVLKNGAWSQQWSFAGPAVADDVDCNNPPLCIGTQGFPSAYDTYSLAINDFPPPTSVDPTVTLVPVPGSEIIILQGSQASGYCELADAQALLAAFTIGINEMKACGPLLEPGLYQQFSEGLANQVFVSCSNSCPCALATADLPPGVHSDAPGNYRGALGQVQRIALNMKRLNTVSKPSHPNWTTDLAELLIHELMHTGGVPHTPPGSEGCPTGLDSVYGTARFCNGCPTLPLTAGSDGSAHAAAIDCSLAVVVGARASCGIDLEINDNAPDVNGDPLTCSCDVSHWAYARSCDDRDNFSDPQLGDCNAYHHLPFVDDAGDPAGQCCQQSSGGMGDCTADPGCTDGWGHWVQLSEGSAYSSAADCYHFPVGTCMSGRAP